MTASAEFPGSNLADFLAWFSANKEIVTKFLNNINSLFPKGAFAMTHTHRYPTELPVEEFKNVLAYFEKSDPAVTAGIAMESGWWCAGYAASFIPHDEPKTAAKPMSDDEFKAALKSCCETPAGNQATAIDWKALLGKLLAFLLSVFAQPSQAP